MQNAYEKPHHLRLAPKLLCAGVRHGYRQKKTLIYFHQFAHCLACWPLPALFCPAAMGKLFIAQPNNARAFVLANNLWSDGWIKSFYKEWNTTKTWQQKKPDIFTFSTAFSPLSLSRVKPQVWHKSACWPFVLQITRSTLTISWILDSPRGTSLRLCDHILNKYSKRFFNHFIPLGF